MTKSITEIEARIATIRKRASEDSNSNCRYCYLNGIEEALMWVIGEERLLDGEE